MDSVPSMETEAELARIYEVPSNPGRYQCPNAACEVFFETHDALILHLNSCYSSIPHSLAMQDIHPTLHDRFPNARARYHIRSGYTFGRQPNTFEQMNHGPFKQAREINPYYPFRSRGEWSLAKFLVGNFTQTQINQFLTLPWFDDNTKPSFTSAEQLLGWVDALPSGPKWQSTVLIVEGYPTTEPIHLIWRDVEEVVASLFGDPIFGANMIFDPIQITTTLGREYSEWFSAHEAHRIQDSLPEGATIVPILAASDKTPVTRMTGGLEMHPLFISIGNIPGNIRMAATSHAWRCMAFMPIPKFSAAPKGCQTMLQARIWHRCVDIVTAGLKRLASKGGFMPDPHGDQRLCFTPLVAWTADLPEQLMIACVSKNASPVTEATYKQFGNAHRSSPRTGELTLERIDTLRETADPWQLKSFLSKARAKYLSGVHLPFWRNWRFANPSIFLLPEILHACLKFFFDHVLPWCKELLGDELDARYKCHHKRVGVRHFVNGVLHVKQMTGREHHEIQRTIIAMIAGCVPPQFLRTVHALIDFIYQAQSPVHTETSVREMELSLQEFHANKVAITEAGARKTKAAGAKADFYIPKLELFHSFAAAIRHSGALIHHSADVSEHLLITHCKRPFERTSKNKDFAEQIVRLLDREEVMRQFDIYTLLRSSNIPLTNVINAENAEVSATNPALSWIAHVLPEEQWQIQGPRPIRDHFITGILTDHAQAALHVTSRPDEANQSLADITMRYCLHDLEARYFDFLRLRLHPDDIELALRTFNCIALWNKFRIQLHSTFCPSKLLPSQVVQTKPPSEDFPYGCCDVVLISPPDGAESYAAQVRAVFQPRAPPRSRIPTPSYLDKPLIYIQPFHIVTKPEQQPELRMYTVKRMLHTEGGRITRVGTIVPIDWVSHVLDLVPVFGSGKVPANVTSATSQELYDVFFLNHFTDKETYNMLHGVM